MNGNVTAIEINVLFELYIVHEHVFAGTAVLVSKRGKRREHCNLEQHEMLREKNKGEGYMDIVAGSRSWTVC